MQHKYREFGRDHATPCFGTNLPATLQYHFTTTEQCLQDNQQPALPPGVDFNMQEAMTPQQLQHLLRQDFNGPNLAGCEVVASKPLMPWMVTISGAINIYGEIKYWDTEIDIRTIENADGLLKLAAALNASFDEAAKRIQAGQTGDTGGN